MSLFKKFTAPNVSKLEQKNDVAGLLDALSYKDPKIPFLAIQALGRLENKDSLHALVSIAKEWKDQKEFQAAAVEALKNTSAKSIQYLVRSLDEALPIYDRDMSEACIEIIGEPAVPILARYARQYRASQVLAKMGAPAVAPLIAAYEESIEKESEATASGYLAILGKVKDPRVGDFLLPLLHHRHYLIREEAARGLGYQREVRAVEDLICILLNEAEEHSVRRPAAFALGKIGDKRAVKPLIQALSDPDSMVRREAAMSLSKPELDESIEPIIDQLITELHSSDHEVRQNAVTLLGDLEKPRTFDAVKALLEDDDDWVCWAAALAITKIDKESGQAAIDALCRVSHKFGETRMGDHFNELVSQCMRCGYKEKEQRRCKKCGGTDFWTVRDDWNDDRFVACKNCGEKVD